MTCNFTATPVSILVLVDVSLEVRGYYGSCSGRGVSILVLVDVSLEVHGQAHIGQS